MSEPNYETRKTPQSHTTKLRKANTLDILINSEIVQKFPAINVSENTFEVFMYSAYESGSNDGYCRMILFNKKQVRLLDFSQQDNEITVAGYWKGNTFPGKEEYELGPTDNRWETLQLIPQCERKKLENFLKKSYAKINFW